MFIQTVFVRKRKLPLMYIKIRLFYSNIFSRFIVEEKKLSSNYLIPFYNSVNNIKALFTLSLLKDNFFQAKSLIF